MFKKHALSFLFFLVVLVSGLCAHNARVVSVKVVADETFWKRHFDWRKNAGMTIEETSYELEKQFQIKLKIQSFQAIEFKEPPYANNRPKIYQDILHLGREVKPEKNGIIVWFSSRIYGDKIFGDGCVDKVLGRCIIVTDEKNLNRIAMSRLLLHEIGHLFGAKHSNDYKSIMFEHTDLSSSIFDAVNTRIILQNKWIAFTETTEQPKQP